MQIMYINNDGGGFADTIEVSDGKSVAALLSERLPGRKAVDFLVRVNRLPATADQLLRDGDRVSMTPTKVQGARSLA
jgi:hypothetical protein